MEFPTELPTHPHRITIGPRHRATVGSYGGVVSYERGTPVGMYRFLMLFGAPVAEPHNLRGSEAGSYLRLSDFYITQL